MCFATAIANYKTFTSVGSAFYGSIGLGLMSAMWFSFVFVGILIAMILVDIFTFSEVPNSRQKIRRNLVIQSVVFILLLFIFSYLNKNPSFRHNWPLVIINLVMIVIVFGTMQLIREKIIQKILSC